MKPGNYATDINIHNPNYKQVPLRKKFIVTVQNGQAVANEPAQTEPRNVVTMTLGADFATMDDCNNLWKYSFPAAPPAGPMPLTIGYLVILSPVELDVDVVYTAGAPGAFNVAPSQYVDRCRARNWQARLLTVWRSAELGVGYVTT